MWVQEWAPLDMPEFTARTNGSAVEEGAEGMTAVVFIAKLYASYVLLVCAAFTFKLWMEARKEQGR